MPPIPLSLHSPVLAEAVTLLRKEKMTCVVTQDGLPELVNQLLYYKEEGKALYPEIYILDDLELMKRNLPYSEFCFIGSGDKTKETMLKALKKCAPLTENGWAIYILRKTDSFEYGVFKVGTSVLSVSISETLIENGSQELKVILIHQIAERIIEVKGIKAEPLIISFASQEEITATPAENQLKFIETITKNVSSDLKDQTILFYKKVFQEVLQKGHGTLSCVLKNKKIKLPEKLKDGIELQEPIDIPILIKNFNDNNDLPSNAKLDSNFSLIVGMMQSDGITIFKNNGTVISYNVFVKHPSKIVQANTSGGARSRTYLTLCEMVGKDLDSAYIQSQDGKIEFKKNE